MQFSSATYSGKAFILILYCLFTDSSNVSENWYSWDWLFTVDDNRGNRIGHKEHFLGRVAKFSGNIRSYQIWIALNVIGIITCLTALYICYFHFDYFHYRLCSVYANLGHSDAQHLMGERLLHGKGVQKDQVMNIFSGILKPFLKE